MKFLQLFAGLSAALIVSFSHAAPVDAPDLTGKSPSEAGTLIGETADTYHDGWGTSFAKGRMILRDAEGTETESKRLKTHALEAANKKEGGRSYIVYDEEGTALITVMNRDKSDSQWVWVPGMKRKWRVKANNITSPFVGSEFAIEDLRSQYPEKYASKLIGEIDCIDPDKTDVTLKCWQLERIPLDENSGYSKQIVTMEQTDYRIIKTVFYDKDGVLLKTGTTHDWQQHASGDNGTFWRSHRNEMVNHQTNRSSTMHIDKIEFGVALKKGDFTGGKRLMK